jgi:hypothetical protein
MARNQLELMLIVMLDLYLLLVFYLIVSLKEKNKILFDHFHLKIN